MLNNGQAISRARNFLLGLSCSVLCLAAFSATAHSQHTIVLKSHEKIVGKVLKYENHKLSILYRGNKITLSDSEVVAIHFQPVTSNDSNSPSNLAEATIKGVVTYFFNDNFGYRPDVGAKVFICDPGEVSFDTSSIRVYTVMHLLQQIQRQPIPPDVQAKFDECDKAAFDEYRKIQSDPRTIRLAADGSGTFTQHVRPGYYAILIVSAHRKDLSLTELDGKINFSMIMIEDGMEHQVQARFDP